MLQDYSGTVLLQGAALRVWEGVLPSTSRTLPTGHAVPWLAEGCVAGWVTVHKVCISLESMVACTRGQSTPGSERRDAGAGRRGWAQGKRLLPLSRPVPKVAAYSI